MRYVLDTNVVSELRKVGAGQNAKVSAWIANVDTSALFLSAITVMELEIGIQRAERKDPRQGIVLRAWMNGRVMPTFAAQVLPIDVKIARRCAALHVPDRRSKYAGPALRTGCADRGDGTGTWHDRRHAQCGRLHAARHAVAEPLVIRLKPPHACVASVDHLTCEQVRFLPGAYSRRPSARSCAFSLRTSWLRSRISATASSPASKSRSSRRPRGRAADPGYETAILPGGRRRR